MTSIGYWGCNGYEPAEDPTERRTDMRYTVTLNRGICYSDITVPMNDCPGLGDEVWYRGLKFTVKAVKVNW